MTLTSLPKPDDQTPADQATARPRLVPDATIEASAADGSTPRPADELSPASNDPHDPALYINRELSWLEFNARVLDEARDPDVPLLERLKFLAIFASNLDEFFMVRVAGLKQQVARGVRETRADGMSAAGQLAAIYTNVHEMVNEQYRVLGEEVLPALEREGVRFVTFAQLTASQKRVLEKRFRQEVFPVLTPLAIDPSHPFPFLRNRSQNLAVHLRRPDSELVAGVGPLAVVQLPAALGRFVEVPPAGKNPGRATYILLGDLITHFIGELFPGLEVEGVYPFRVTRNADLALDEEEAEDLLVAMQKELRRRERGAAVRLEIDTSATPTVHRMLMQALSLGEQDVYEIDGPLNLAEFMQVYGALGDLSDLRDPPFTPQDTPELASEEDTFAAVSKGDVLLHHPYESYDQVVDFIREAAEDPRVLAIKMTLYRTSGDSPVIQALAHAAENGKQVTALVELKARFDEQQNIVWARALEESGVHVVYGFIGLKTHCKVALVVRREAAGLRRYVHLSTGNYNPSTGRLYTDLSFFTCREEFAEDASALFNLLTGYSQPPAWQRLFVAPLGLRTRLLELIEREGDHAEAGRPARIVAKMNALSDDEVVRALYRASRRGVKIDLLVRGICCLRPGLPGWSENIRVRSIVDRYLEHSRIFGFENGGKREVYLSSADWMQRNLRRRVEVMFPVEDEQLASRVFDEILALELSDNVHARELQPDGSYVRAQRENGEDVLRAQVEFQKLALDRAAELNTLHGKGVVTSWTELTRRAADGARLAESFAAQDGESDEPTVVSGT